MHYYKKNIGDYHKKAGRLSMLQHGSYTLLMDSCYDREKFPTKEEAIDWCWASSKEEIEAVEFVLSKFFVLIDGVYVQDRIDQELKEYQSKAKTNKRIAMEREAKRKENLTNRARTVDESPPNHKPITINQEPRTNIKDKGAKAPATQRFIVPDLNEICLYFESKGCLDPSQPQLFFNFYGSKGWMVGKNKMKCWKSAASNWMARSKQTPNQQNGQYKTAQEKRAERNAEIFDYDKATKF